ncbi:MAG: hypothetical protein IJ949_00330 [Oscillospiraceae bacterium]|nr:hypothetical protein [Oscillospiraceae bacterium]
MKKRIISAVLALCLLLSLVPTGVFATDKSGVTIKYDIQSACAPDGITKTDSVDAGQNASDYITYDTTNDFFKYVTDSVNLADGGNVKIVDEGGVIYVKYNNWLILQLNVPVAGEYEIYVNNSTHNQGGVGLFYIFPESVTPNASAFTEENYVGELLNNKAAGNPSGVGGGWSMTLDEAQPVQKDGKNATYNFNTAGKYYMAVKAYTSASITGTQNRFNFGNIWLVGGPGKAYMGKSELPEEKLTVMHTKTRDVSLSVLLSDNTWGNADISNCQSLDTSIATVTDSGKVRGVSIGETTVSFDASYGGVFVGNFTLPVKVTENDGITIKYDLAKLYSEISTNTDTTFAGNITYENTDDFFKYASDSRNDPAKKNYHLRWKANGTIEMYQGNWIFLEINVPKAGEYDISVYNGKALLGGDLSVYVLESDGGKPTAADLTEGNFVGTIHCDDSTVAAGKVAKVTTPTPVGSHYFKAAGKYYIGFQAHDTDVVPDPLPEGDNVANYADSAYVGDIVMRSGDNLAAMKSYPKAETMTLAPDQQEQLTAYALLSDVTETELVCTDFEIADGGENIVSVSDDGVVTQ